MISSTSFFIVTRTSPSVVKSNVIPQVVEHHTAVYRDVLIVVLQHPLYSFEALRVFTSHHQIVYVESNGDLLAVGHRLVPHAFIIRVLREACLGELAGEIIVP